MIRESEQINLPVNPAKKQISLSLKNISGKLKTSDALRLKTWSVPYLSYLSTDALRLKTWSVPYLSMAC